MLGIDQRQQALDHRELVAADAARRDLRVAGLEIEPPLVAVLDDRNGAASTTSSG